MSVVKAANGKLVMERLERLCLKTSLSVATPASQLDSLAEFCQMW